jgi:two-component system response regulator NreC
MPAGNNSGIVLSMSTALVVDDHPIVRDGLRLLLQQHPEIDSVAEAATSQEALEQTRSLQPGLIVLDVGLGDENGLDMLPALRAVAPEAKVLVLSIHDDPCYVRQALAAGANAYLLKDTADRELLTAISVIENGQRYIEPQLGASVVEADERDRIERETDTLTTREHEILQLLALGNTNQEIARQLGLSTRTIESHRYRLMRKLGLKSRADLIRHALDHGLLNTQPANNHT